MGYGINPTHWWAKGSGAEMELGKSLEPLAPLKTKLNVINGLFNKAATGVGIHPGQTGNILSGAPLQKGAVLQGGISMDQVLANHLGEETVQPSLVLGCEQPITGYHETNFSMAYSSHISWQNATSPVPMEVYPSLAFDSLFDNRGSRRNQSILDRVTRARRRASAARSAQPTRRKLDEYLTSVREVEKRIDMTRGDQDEGRRQRASDRGQPLVAMTRPDNGLPEDIREHMRLMCDIVALAFQTDKTRVATLLLCRDISGLFYPFLDVRTAHHSASHDDLSDDYERITRYYVSQLAYLASRLDAMPEGDGTVLDNSCLMFLSNMWSGSKHDSTQAAAAPGRRPGRHARNRPRPRLHGRGRRQPQAVQPVPVAHGPHGREARPLRRRHRAPERHLMTGLAAALSAVTLAWAMVQASTRPVPPTRDPHTPGYVAAKELPDGVVPPADVDGNFIIGPTHTPAPEMVRCRTSVPQGTICNFTMSSADSKIYPGIARDAGTFGTRDPADPAKLDRDDQPSGAVHAPGRGVCAQAVRSRHGRALHRRRRWARPAAVHGARQPDRAEARAADDRASRSATAAATRRAASAASNTTRCPGATRSSSRRRCCRWSSSECNVKLTKDPEGRATMGCSSGGSAALIMAWYHPELYHRVLTYSGTYVNQQWPPNADTPHGAWEFHERLIPNSPAKPIRIWMEVGDRDLLNPNVMRDDMHDWVEANERMARVLAAKGYRYQFVFARNAGHSDRAVKQQTLPAALEWLWRGYR